MASRPWRGRRELLVALLTVSLLVLTPVSAGTAQAAPPSFSVSLDLDVVRGVAYAPEVDRVLVAGDNEAQIWSMQGALLHRIPGISGALDPDVTGRLGVVAAPATGELVVIDLVTGDVVKRIFSNAQKMTSIAAVGDTIWYNHGPDQWDAGIGKASIAAGTGTAYYLDGYRAGGLIDVSPGRPESVFYTPVGSSPADIRRFDEDGTELDSPYHDTFQPIHVRDDGQVVWAFNNGNVIEMDPDDLTRTGMFYEAPAGGSAVAITSWRSERLAVGYLQHSFRSPSGRDEFVVATHVPGAPAIASTARYASRIVDVALSADRLIVVESGSTSWGPNATGIPKLTVSGFDHVYAPLPVEVYVAAVGEYPGGRVTVNYSCNRSDSGTIVMEYDTPYVIDVHPLTTSCTVWRTGGPTPLSTWYYVPVTDEWVRGDRMTIDVGGDPSLDFALLLDDFGEPDVEPVPTPAPDGPPTTQPPAPDGTPSTQPPAADPPIGTTGLRQVVTGYSSQDLANIEAAAAYLGLEPSTFQVTGVYVLHFINGLAGNVGPAPLGPYAPSVTGPAPLPSSWGPDDESILAWVREYYMISDAQAQKVGSTLLYFLASIDARNNGTPLPAG